ncbi:hypothetical protein Afil01_04990 [Actinorhabdospora filicis]|uniref:CobQ/CobB/MinD/ParA nucleotide binding domain-containing protein n=1 Tax=Actinorhabdospora filicis TaxID=1785913 RepID=A0A9W6SH02_9ACTN|nr:AAA family ATPase [Actinorhabdospora filicis]GLZ75692.1 hypothetical protein Afil01_04990 [Actinorhabdospora filicis]
MKVAFVGKGGSGKTTLASLFARRLARQGNTVFAIDADVNQHLACALGMAEMDAVALPTLGDALPRIKEHLRGDNPRIASAEQMLKTTPPGPGSRLVRVAAGDPILRDLTTEIGGVRLAVTGGFTENDLGVACYHSKTGAVELLLNHIVDLPGQYVIVDMIAGAEAFASGMFTRFDTTFLVCEPTVRSVGVFKQYAGYAADFDVRIAVIGNKVDDESDVDFLREHVGDALVGWVGRSAFVKAGERGKHLDITDLEPANLTVLDTAKALLDSAGKDWIKFTRQAHEFHRRNAEAWGSERAGADLSAQIDPEYVLGPQLLETAPVLR